MPSSIETLAQTSIKHISMSYAREILKQCSQHYNFDFEEACQRFSLREQDLPVPLFDHTESQLPVAAPQPAKNDMISNLLTNVQSASPELVSPNTIRRKRAARMNSEEKAELARMKEEEKISKKLAREEKKREEASTRKQQKELRRLSKEAIKSAEKAEKHALKALSKIIKIAEKAAKTKKTKKIKDPDAPKRTPSAYLLFSNQTRPLLKQQMPHLQAKEVISELAKRWKALSTLDRQPFIDQASHYKMAEQANSSPSTLRQEETCSSPSFGNQSSLEEVTVEEYARGKVGRESTEEGTDESAEESADEEEEEVDELEIQGTKYLVGKDNGNTYDSETHELIGIYDFESKELTVE